MPKFIDLAGMKFNRWTVIEKVGKEAQGIVWMCRCDCGTEKTVSGGNLRSGLSKSCGCWNLEQVRSAKKHGMSKSPEFKVWKLMRNRCNNTDSPDYPRWGGRGIRVCPRWDASFSDFYADMGPRPDGTSIERMDNNGNYDPGNCKWATDEEQAHNKRNNRVLVGMGKTQLLCDWAKETGISASLLHYHLKQGKTMDEIIARG